MYMRVSCTETPCPNSAILSEGLGWDGVPLGLWFFPCCGTGPLGPASDEPRHGPASQAGVHPQTRRQETPTRHPRDPGPGRASPGLSDTGAGVGSAVRAEIVRLPARPRLSERNRGDLLDGQGQQSPPPVGTGRGFGSGVQPHRPRPPSPPTRFISCTGTGQGSARRVAETERARLQRGQDTRRPPR